MAQLVTKFGYLKDNKTRSRGGYAKGEYPRKH